MTEAEAVAVEVPTTEPPAADAAPFDEALLIKEKGRVVEPKRPDDTERNMLVSKLQAEIQKNSDRIRDIKQLVEEKRGNAKYATQGSQDIMKRMQGFKNEFQSVLRQKQHIRAELQQVTAERDELRNLKRDLQNDLRTEVRVFTLEAVDSRLQELESKLNHESLDIQTENHFRSLVKKLTAAKPKIIELDAASAKLNENEQIRTEIIERLKQCDDVLSAIKEKETKERGALDELKSRGDDQTADVPALNVEKQECYDIIVACREKIQSIREEYNKKYEDYIKADRNYRAWRNWDRKQKYEQRQKERAERNKQREQEQQQQQRGAADFSFIPEPYESEIFVCDQAIVYLKKFLASDEVQNKQEVKDLGAPAPGMTLFRRKTDDDLESMFTGLGKKKGKKNEKPAEKKPVDKKFSHDLDTLKIFMSIGVAAPTSTADVQKTLDAVIAKKEEFQAKQKKAKEDEANGVHGDDEDDAGPSESAPENGNVAENGDTEEEPEAEPEVEVEEKVDEAEPVPTAEDAEAPASAEAEVPASAEAEAPASVEAEAPASAEAEAPPSAEAEAPANAEAEAPASAEAEPAPLIEPAAAESAPEEPEVDMDAPKVKADGEPAPKAKADGEPAATEPKPEAAAAAADEAE